MNYFKRLFTEGREEDWPLVLFATLIIILIFIIILI